MPAYIVTSLATPNAPRNETTRSRPELKEQSRQAALADAPAFTIPAPRPVPQPQRGWFAKALARLRRRNAATTATPDTRAAAREATSKQHLPM